MPNFDSYYQQSINLWDVNGRDLSREEKWEGEPPTS
jgi:hypothetical protein